MTPPLKLLSMRFGNLSKAVVKARPTRRRCSMWSERLLGLCRAALEARIHFNASDGWAIASHIALSILISLFPFLIVVTGVSGLVGSENLAREAGRLLLDAWPEAVPAPIAAEFERVATSAQGQAITAGAVFSIYFATGAIESLRLGLNRAYGAQEKRSWFGLQLRAMVYVVGCAIALLAFSVLVILGPIFTAVAERHLPWLTRFVAIMDLGRFSVASILLATTLVAAHYWLPAGRRRLVEIIPGIAVTLTLWLLAGAGFGAYLGAFADSYVVTYAGLASAMIALAFLYFSAAIFIYGGELNAALMRRARDNP